MRKIITVILCVLLAVGVVGGSFVLAKHIDGKSPTNESQNESSLSDESSGEDGNDSNAVSEEDSGSDSNSVPDEDNNSSFEDSTPQEPEIVSVWQLCHDTADLSVGDKIVLVVQSTECALGTTQNTSNRSAAKVTKDSHTVTLSDDVQIITLEEGVVENTFALNVGTGYLYAASSTNNQLKTHDSIDENSSWSITIDSSCVANVIAQGESSRNVLMYNLTSNLFSCYASTQEPLMIYKLVERENN